MSQLVKKTRVAVPLDKSDIEIEDLEDGYSGVKVDPESRVYLVLDGTLYISAWHEDADKGYATTVERADLNVTATSLRII